MSCSSNGGGAGGGVAAALVPVLLAGHARVHAPAQPHVRRHHARAHALLPLQPVRPHPQPVLQGHGRRRRSSAVRPTRRIAGHIVFVEEGVLCV